MSRNRPTTRALHLTAILATAALLLPAELAAQSRRALELEDYYRLKSVGGPTLSPDGSRVAFVVTSVLEDANRRHSEVWLANAEGSGEPIRLTSPSFSASNPAWTPDGSHIYFSSRRPAPTGDTRGGPWFLRIGGTSGEAFQIDGLDGSPNFSPDGRWIAFTRAVPPDGTAPGPVYDTDFERRTAERFDGRVQRVAGGVAVAHIGSACDPVSGAGLAQLVGKPVQCRHVDVQRRDLGAARCEGQRGCAPDP